MKEKVINWAKALYYRVLESIRAWNEWQDAKCWAYEFHPGWVHLATRAKTEETRKKYRDKIMLAYLGENNMTNAGRCIRCGESIPEGWLYCDTCWEDANFE